MQTLHLLGVNEDKLYHYHELLPSIWNTVKSRWWGHLIYILAKTWDCGQQIVSFSTWLVGNTSIACAVRFSKNSGSCEVIINSGTLISHYEKIEAKFVEAITIALISE